MKSPRKGKTWNEYFGKKKADIMRKKLSNSCLGRVLSVETCKKLSEFHKGCIPWNKGKKMSLSFRRKMSEVTRGRKLSDESKRKISKARLGEGNGMYGRCGALHPRFGKSVSKKTRMKMQKAHKKLYKNGYVNPMTGRKHSKETRLKMSKNRSGKCLGSSNPSFGGRPDWVIKKVVVGSHVKPNKFEIAVRKYLNLNFPKEWKYCGDGSVILNGHNPDFINCNGEKKVILANGVYWHRKRFPNLTRVEIEKVEAKSYSDIGFDVWFIWDDDFKNL